MVPGRVASARERARISALAAGVAATVICWTFTAAFAPGELESLSQYSAWLYGPVATTAWALFSALAYLFIFSDQRRRGSEETQDTHEGYRCRDFAPAVSANCGSVCANPEEKARLAAISAGFALTISIWVATLSFMPEGWLDWLGEASPWSYCVASVVLCAALSEAMYPVFRGSRERSR